MKRKPNVIVRHVRHPGNPSRYLGTVAMVRIPGNDRAAGLEDLVGVSFSQCHSDDVFIKKVGRDKAIGRATSVAFGRTPRDRHGDPLRPVPIKFFNKDGSRYRINPLAAVMNLLSIRAHRLWGLEVGGVLTGVSDG